MKPILNIALVQTVLVWEDAKANRVLLEKEIRSIAKADIIILPEMFTSGFTMNAQKVAESMQGETISWLLKLSNDLQVAICGSLAIKDDAEYFNRFVFVEPSGKITSYDKRHTFTLTGEGKVYKRGVNQIIIAYKGWKICPLICYDLRFPVWARNTQDYDVLVYVANWPKERIHAWDTLLRARAIENMSYCVGVNRVGTDANNLEYVGHSAVYDALGKTLLVFEAAQAKTKTIALHKTDLSEQRNKFRFLNDKDEFNLVIETQ
ncbi:MAG: amidohydrolase [Flavobacteriaceae bacterium]|nr:amidohydrolase [Flavobacteriaceae bacterium]